MPNDHCGHVRSHLLRLSAVLILAAGSVGEMACASLTPGDPAPAFTLPTLADGVYSLRDDQGKIRLINFWATWCEPCQEEMPAIQKAYKELQGEGFTVLAIDVAEDPEGVQAFVDRYGLTFPILLDRDNTVANRYGVVSLPATLFVDQTGRIRHRVKGGGLTAPKIHSIVEQIQATEISPQSPQRRS